MNTTGIRRPLDFIATMRDLDAGGYRSVSGGPVTLYGTCYALLARYYLGCDEDVCHSTSKFITGCQDEETGLMIGPELRAWTAGPRVLHDREHLLFHLTCAAVPAARHFGLHLQYPIHAAHRFRDLNFLAEWLNRRDLRHAWFEGNNILFAGQLLVYLRDVERWTDAHHALDFWFNWLDEHIDPMTGLWGTNGYCSARDAVYGGYHQLLVYNHENRPLPNLRGLVDTVLALQHADGGFNPNGNGGACEDVDCVDILTNVYKRNDYRRAEIRCALRQCLRHILALQNADGGFPYNRDCLQSHMGVPGTEAASNQSTMFATWFRVHTLALIAEILTDEPELQFPFRFTNNLSMGWHRSWNKDLYRLTSGDREAEKEFEWRWRRRRAYVEIRRPFRLLKQAIARMRTRQTVLFG